MSSFKDFMDEAEESPTKALPSSNTSLSAIQTSLALSVGSLLAPFSDLSDKKEEFSEKVSNLVRDEAFLSDFSDRIGDPLELESEDDFVERSSDVLRKMLYEKFGLKS